MEFDLGRPDREIHDLEPAGESKNPCDDLEHAKENRQVGAKPSPRQNAGRLGPGIDRQDHRRWRGHTRNWPEANERRQRQHKGGTVVEGALVFQLGQFSLFAASVQADWAEMFVVQLHVTQSAQELSADGARNDRALLGMVKATGLPFDEDGLARLPFRDLFEERRESLHLQQSVAAGAGSSSLWLENGFRNGRLALGAADSLSVPRLGCSGKRGLGS